MDSTVLSLASSGLQAQQKQIDLIAHNLANVQTPGFRAIRPELVDMPANPGIYGTSNPVGLTTANDPTSGVAIAGWTQPDQTGPIITTGSPLDVALPDGIYLAVQLPNGQTAYTRDGRVQVNANGGFQVGDNPLAGNLRLQAGDSDPAVNDRGQIVVTGPQGKRILGALPLVRVNNPEGLNPMGLGLLSATPVSGTPQPFVSNGLDGITTGALEGSNVQMDQQMATLLQAQRAYQAGTQMVQTWDLLTSQTVRDLGNS